MNENVIKALGNLNTALSQENIKDTKWWVQIAIDKLLESLMED